MTNRKIVRSGVFFIILVVSPIIFATETLSTQEIVQLVQASRQQYDSFEIQLTQTSYECKDFIYDVNHPDEEDEILWRSSKLGTYAKIKYKTFNYLGDDAKAQEKQHLREYAITPKWSKKLKDVPTSNTPRGIVANGDSIKEELPFTIDEAIWGIFSYKWDKLASEDTELTYNEDDNTYTLKKQVFPDGTMITVVIDQAKGFLPIKYEFHKPSGELLIRCEGSDFRKTKDNLWLPYQYVFATQSYMSIYKVQHAEVNLQFPKESLDFSFPPGTIIEDQIANLRYVVGGPQENEDIIDLGAQKVEMPVESVAPAKPSKPNRVTIDDIENPKHAEEDKLLNTYEKAQTLIEKENQALAESKANKNAKFESLKFVIFPMIIVIVIILLVKYRFIVKTKKNLKNTPVSK